MSTPQNPYSGSDEENNQNIPGDQPDPDLNRPQDPAADEQTAHEPSANVPSAHDPGLGEQPGDPQSHAGTAQYGQGSQFSQSGQYSQADQHNGQQSQFGQSEPYNQQSQFGQQQQFGQGGQGGQYTPQDQYDQGGQYDPQNQYGQYGQPAQQGQYYQDADYAAYNQGNYAGSQHAPVGNFQQPAAQQKPGGSGGFFKSLFDFRFDNLIAVRWAGFIYIIAIVVAALSWLGSIIGGIVTGAAAGAATSYLSDGPSFSPWPLLLAIIFGWIIPALWVIFVRLALELIVANVKTAENTKRIADSLGR
ncbi:DUF4282 domain-containing protein [Brevibacterium sp. UCMA 11752]|uniref:DUF4282 domain-containing protein n=1 Tax=Brevibacterium sp. UCMA 11752 TaxID=2745946 RepID=UPI001F1C26F0|nr:DUF4282 domain-containing protein [Brevibacterium sp. UCMA 11752]MCF2587590.1 DUF4282 domain-containing protein [Brevibacterium sp. UCMA 11752]